MTVGVCECFVWRGLLWKRDVPYLRWATVSLIFLTGCCRESLHVSLFQGLVRGPSRSENHKELASMLAPLLPRAWGTIFAEILQSWDAL